MRFLGMLLLSGMAWAAVGDVPSLRRVPPPRPFAAAHQLNVASSASLEPGGRAGRHLMQPESCQFAPDAKPWCSEIPQHLCEEASDLGLVIRSHCATTCQICKVIIITSRPRRLPRPAEILHRSTQASVLQESASVQFRNTVYHCRGSCSVDARKTLSIKNEPYLVIIYDQVYWYRSKMPYRFV